MMHMETIAMNNAERDFEAAACKYRVENVVTLDPKLTSGAWTKLNSNPCKAHYELLPLIIHIGLIRTLTKGASRESGRKSKIAAR